MSLTHQYSELKMRLKMRLNNGFTETQVTLVCNSSRFKCIYILSDWQVSSVVNTNSNIPRMERRRRYAIDQILCFWKIFGEFSNPATVFVKSLKQVGRRRAWKTTRMRAEKYSLPSNRCEQATVIILKVGHEKTSSFLHLLSLQTKTQVSFIIWKHYRYESSYPEGLDSM